MGIRIVCVCICRYHVSMSLYVYLLWDNCDTTRVCGLTDDGVSSHFLAYHCCIAAQEHWKWGHVWACVTLVDFVHVTAVDCPILALLACRVHLVKLSVLPASKAGRSQQLLDRVVQGAVEEHHALSTIGGFGKVFLQYPARNFQLYRIPPHGSHPHIADPFGLEIGIGCPLEQSIPIWITRVRCWRGVMREYLELRSVEMRIGLCPITRTWNGTIDRPRPWLPIRRSLAGQSIVLMLQILTIYIHIPTHTHI